VNKWWAEICDDNAGLGPNRKLISSTDVDILHCLAIEPSSCHTIKLID